MSEPSRGSDRASREMVRAAEEISKAAEEVRRAFVHGMGDYVRLLDELQEVMALSESIRRHRSLLQSVPELPEEEVALIADKSVHRYRKSAAREWADQPKAPPPTAEEIREWERRREERRKREAS
jgi:hypothetical protein